MLNNKFIFDFLFILTPNNIIKSFSFSWNFRHKIQNNVIDYTNVILNINIPNLINTFVIVFFTFIIFLTKRPTFIITKK